MVTVGDLERTQTGVLKRLIEGVSVSGVPDGVNDGVSAAGVIVGKPVVGECVGEAVEGAKFGELVVTSAVGGVVGIFAEVFVGESVLSFVGEFVVSFVGEFVVSCVVGKSVTTSGVGKFAGTGVILGQGSIDG